ncbi:hypothetical protein [Sphingomonas sp.]|uniref:hypothetical protein n=1 Tax=Sphingomonas sp. TaxID=28214 RepID=UPI00356910F6
MGDGYVYVSGFAVNLLTGLAQAARLRHIALNASASKPGVVSVASSTLSARARAINSCESEISAGVLIRDTAR